MVEPASCPECHSERTDFSVVCPTCGAPPLRDDEQRGAEEEVREHDLEPYIALRYIARLFKIFAVIMLILSLAEIVLGLSTDAAAALSTLIGEVTKLLIFGGLLWGIGDLTLLIIDAGHDLRVVRILLGRINAELHRQRSDDNRDSDRNATESARSRGSSSREAPGTRSPEESRAHDTSRHA